MKRTISSIIVGVFVTLTSHASVTINFDSDLQGFQSAGGGGTFGWSSVNGGSMALTNSSGWHGDMVKLQLADYPAIWSELQSAETNGGTLEFDVIVRESDQIYTGGSGSVQLIVVGSSDTGGWVDNNVAWTALPVNSGLQTVHVMLPIATSGTSQGGTFVASGTWANLQIGLNNGGTVTSGTVYIDNVKVTAIVPADITFNTDLQGFQSAGGGGTFGWSSIHGGSMALTNTGGYHSDMVKLQLADYPTLWSKLQNAQTNGGSLQFDVIMRTSDQVYTGGDAWVQVIVVGNSDTGGWKNNNVDWTALPVSGGAQTNHITLPIASTGIGGDGHFVVSGAWANLQIGLNIGSTVTSGTIYIDNVSIFDNSSTNTTPLPVIWQDADPQQSSVTTSDSDLSLQSGQADPAGGTNNVGVLYYNTSPHPDYRNIGMQIGANNIGTSYQLQKPLGGGYMWANINSNYYGGTFTFSVDVYVPSSSPIGTDAGDDITPYFRWPDSGGNYTTTLGQAVNLSLRDQWQTITLTGTIPTTNSAIAQVVAAIGVHDDPTTEIPINVAVCYLRNINFQLNPPGAVVTPPTITWIGGGGNLNLNWTASGFKLQSETNLNTGSWADYALPAGTNPPVSVPIVPANGAVFFRLAPQ